MRQEQQQPNRFHLLNVAHNRLALDLPTRDALLHVRSFAGFMLEKGVEWDGVPDELDIDDMFHRATSRLALRVFRKQAGFRLFEAAINYPEERIGLLANYVKLIEVAEPAGNPTLEPAKRYLADQGFDHGRRA